MRTSNIRFTGLASGLDTESMVQAMIMPYKNKVDSAGQQQKLLELKKDAWKEMNTKLLNFHTNFLNKLRLESTFNKTNIAVSNSNVISLDKNITIPEGNHTIEIESMAKGATVSSKSIGASKGTKLDTLGIKEGTEISVTVGGKTATVKVEDKDVNGNKESMTVGDLESKMAEELKKQGIKDVNFKFDEKVGAFVVNSKTTGKEPPISLSSKTANPSDPDPLAQLGFVKNQGGTYDYSGENARIIYNGGIEVESPSNNIEINGLKFTITGETKDVISITSTQDTEVIVDFAKNFVDEYNKLIEEMHKLIDAPKNKKYMPLTDEQKADMTESDIKLWEERINASILSNDPTLRAITSSMREILGGTVEGNKYSNLSQIGIKTGNWKDNGRLILDEEKLRKAINEDKQAVVNLLSGEGDPKALYNKEKNDPTAWDQLTKDEKEAYTQETKDKRLSIGDRLYNAMNERLKGTQSKSGNTFYNDKTLQKEIEEYQKKASKLEEQMTRMEDMYYKKFTAMEKALSQLNNQSNWLMSQLGGM